MAFAQTISMIKSDTVARNVIGEIYSRFEKADLCNDAARMLHLSKERAGEFHAAHKQRPFCAELVNYMTSGPVMVQVLEGENAVVKNREVMTATHPKDVALGTIWADFAHAMTENAVPGSAAAETARAEIVLFFGADGVCQWPC